MQATAGTTAAVSLSALAQEQHVANLGNFTLSWSGNANSSSINNAQLVITHPKHPLGPVFATVPGQPFVTAGRGGASFVENHGGFVITDNAVYCSDQEITSWEARSDAVILTGRFTAPGCEAPWSLTFSLVDAERLRFSLHTSQANGPANLSRASLTYASRPDEHFFGFGEQYSVFDMKGRALPIFAMEQGIGRGASPISDIITLFEGKGVAGDWWTSYAPVPQYITSDAHSLFLENTEYSLFDLRSPNDVRVMVMSDTLTGQILAGASPPALLEEFTRYAGRMQPLPAWVDAGAIVGLQGGTAVVRQRYAQLQAAGVPMSALWLQDWVGKRKTPVGSLLWWNWVLNPLQYPDWSGLLEGLAQDSVRVLTYV